MDEICKAIQSRRDTLVRRIYFNDSDTIVEEVDENPFDKAAAEADLEKSDVMDALSYQGEVKIAKKGKDIKNQVDNVLLPELTSILAVKEGEATEKLKCCGQAPTNDPDRWWTDGIKMDCGYKIYSWEETCFHCSEDRVMSSLSASDAEEKKGNAPDSQEQANCRREYNDLVRAICNIKVDIKACDILKGLKDETEYELTPRQILALKF